MIWILSLYVPALTILDPIGTGLDNCIDLDYRYFYFHIRSERSADICFQKPLREVVMEVKRPYFEITNRFDELKKKFDDVFGSADVTIDMHMQDQWIEVWWIPGNQD